MQFQFKDMVLCLRDEGKGQYSVVGTRFTFLVARLNTYIFYAKDLLTRAELDQVPSHSVGICANLAQLHHNNMMSRAEYKEGDSSFATIVYRTYVYLEYSFNLLGYECGKTPIEYPIGSKWIGKHKEARIQLLKDLIALWEVLIEVVNTMEQQNEV